MGSVEVRIGIVRDSENILDVWMKRGDGWNAAFASVSARIFICSDARFRQGRERSPRRNESGHLLWRLLEPIQL